MSTSTQYPNGQVLTSTAFTPNSLSTLIQQLTCGMLGINPPDPAKVRISWPTEGQPFEDVNIDVCYIMATPQAVDYSLLRNTWLSQQDVNSPLVQNFTYTRGWRIKWIFYGPNSTDRARMVHSAVAFMDYFADLLANNNLFPLPDAATPTRTPEQKNAQWWERADFHCDMYENVEETIQLTPATSVEIQVLDNTGLEADFTVKE